MTSIVVHCNWTSATALVTSTPQCHHICFTTCLPPLPRDLSSIVTSAAVSIMLNLRSKTKWHWGESPTSGVNQDQLQNAVQYIHHLSGKLDGDLAISVVGPSFSGSLSSLASNLANSAAFPVFQKVKFHFASGMVTSALAIHNFKDDIQKIDGAYDSTIESDDRAMDLFVRYVLTIWPSVRVALLTEQETAWELFEDAHHAVVVLERVHACPGELVL